MNSKLIFTFFLFPVLTGCVNVHQEDHFFESKSSTTIIQPTSNSSNEFEINCDTIYRNKFLKIKLSPLNKGNNHELNYTFIFQLLKEQNKQKVEIYRDTIVSLVQKVEFIDFNNDNIKDILIQNSSDVRSNWTYNLYLVDKTKTKVQKIRGFEKIKNPKYLPKYDLIDNKVMSGRNWTSFYKIQGDSIIDYQIIVYEEGNKNEKSTYGSEYKKAIKRIIGN